MEVSVRPGPEVAVTIAAVVALQAVAEHVAPDDPVIERYFTGKHGIGMRRAREANPAFAAQSHLEVRMILEVPGDLMATNVVGSVNSGPLHSGNSGTPKDLQKG